MPLYLVENQPYIHYRKGSLIMYALQDYIGEENVNKAIRAYRDDWAFKGPPYSSASHLIAKIRAVTPPHLQYMIDDFFETITLYDNRALSAKAKVLPDGRYEVALKVFAKKRKADALGKEAEAPLADWMDIGVLDADGQPLLLEKQKIEQEETSFTLVVPKKPARAGIDPYNKLIDRRPKDNAIPVEIE
jgi:ABC-2 type transport system permease protein